MLKHVRRRARRALELAGLIGPYYRWRERQAIRTPVEAVDDGLPMPPRELIMAVSGTQGQPSWFSAAGRRDADRFAELAERHGRALASGVDVLDFGCGAGRIARWLAATVVSGGGGFHGSDINPSLVGWCREHLPGSYSTNALQPPLPLAAASLDVVYAHSVLTHLRERTARAWLAELRRVLRPRGLALLTFHDENYAERWGPPEARAGLQHQGYVVVNDALEGSNYMSAWTTRAGFRELVAADFEVLEVVPGGLEQPDQAIGVLRARPA